MRSCAFALTLIAVSCSPVSVSEPVEMGASPRSGNPAPAIAAFCVSKNGQRVGNGECWTLVDEAFKAAGRRRPGSDMRVWGCQVNFRREPLKPGDVIEFQSAWFADGTITGSAHTVVVVRGGSQGKCAIAEQNWGKKTVRIREMDLATLRSGKFSIYRPQ